MLDRKGLSVVIPIKPILAQLFNQHVLVVKMFELLIKSILIQLINHHVLVVEHMIHLLVRIYAMMSP